MSKTGYFTPIVFLSPRRRFERDFAQEFKGRFKRLLDQSHYQESKYHGYEDDEVQERWFKWWRNSDTQLQNLARRDPTPDQLEQVRDQVEGEISAVRDILPIGSVPCNCENPVCCRIPEHDKPAITSFDISPGTEVPYEKTFFLDDRWALKRAWRYWIVEGGVPRDLAHEIHAECGMSARADGHVYGSIPVDADCSVFHVDTLCGFQFLLYELHKFYVRSRVQVQYTRRQVRQAFASLGGEARATTQLLQNRETNTERADILRSFFNGKV